MKLKDLINYLENVYCGKVGYEYMHVMTYNIHINI